MSPEHERDIDAAAGRRAVVIGGSIGGLLVARVLSDHFDEVVMIERDSLPERPEPRKGVPQGRHLHGLLSRGTHLLDQMFPGIVAGLVRGGAVQLDWAGDLRWYHFGTWKVRYESGVDAIGLSRPFLEHEVRRRVLALPRVRGLDAHEVTGLIASADRAGIGGVRLRGREDGAERTLRAALVVDATGRGSVVPRWLEELGYERPAESKVTVHVGYATRIYRRVEPSPFPWKALLVYSRPEEGGRLGGMVPIEGGRFLALVAGILRDYPPDDDAGWLAFARSLPVDTLHAAALASEPIGDIATYHFPHHLRRHYERLQRQPEGFIVVGDALCSFNPSYGQGITTAALEAEALGESLREHRSRRGDDLRGFARRYQAQAGRLIDIPWTLATSEDFRFAQVEGRRPPGYPLLAWYLGRVHRAVGHDTEVMGHFLKVMHMLESPMHLFRPDVALRVLRG